MIKKKLSLICQKWQVKGEIKIENIWQGNRNIGSTFVVYIIVFPYNLPRDYFITMLRLINTHKKKLNYPNGSFCKDGVLNRKEKIIQEFNEVQPSKYMFSLFIVENLSCYYCPED